jgi:hypothetical protein
MPEEKKIRLVYDLDLKRPACALLQAAMGGDSHALYEVGFTSEDWLISPTPGMRLIAGTLDEWHRAVEITHRNKEKKP